MYEYGLSKIVINIRYDREFVSCPIVGKSVCELMLNISYTQAIYQQSIWSVHWYGLNKVVTSKTGNTCSMSLHSMILQVNINKEFY